MFGIKKVRQYNSKIYHLSDTRNCEEFYGILDTLNDFDFAVERMKVCYIVDLTQATIHVETKEKMLEIWLIKHQFELA